VNSIIQLRGVSKYFLNSRALHEVDLDIFEGECLGIVGHNGAGKSTIVNILTGVLPATSGSLRIDDSEPAPGYDVHAARLAGIRVVFQELSLCPNLTVAENMKVFHPQITGTNWKGAASQIICDTLNEVFPGHGVSPDTVVSDLTLGQRQMLEIAKAFTTVDSPLRLVVLDEPTSALDQSRSQQLIDYLDTLREKRLSVIYISHLLEEVLASTDRIVVMKDGIKVGTLVTEGATKEQVIDLMGEAKAGAGPGSKAKQTAEPTGDEAVESSEEDLLILPRQQEPEDRLRLRKGEVVGLTGLAGHGQTRLLVDLFDLKHNKDYSVRAGVTFVPGDRQTDGVFPVWSIAKNISVQVYHRIRKFFLIDSRKERTIARNWQKAIDIKAPSMEAGILSLSGGNQQKALFARCLESDADIVLMDDPTRGVDVGTKEVIYRRIIEEKKAGRSFLWYTTEMDELAYCDRLYVFKGGKIIAELSTGAATEEEILKASF
jgi:ribose transport system ATP-binding protein